MLFPSALKLEGLSRSDIGKVTDDRRLGGAQASSLTRERGVLGGERRKVIRSTTPVSETWGATDESLDSAGLGIDTTELEQNGSRSINIVLSRPVGK